MIFVTLPNVFNHMPMGELWGALFFVFMTFAALSTVLAVFENILSCCMDLFGWSRKKACLINAIALLILSLPCALGFNLLSGIHPLGGSSNFLDLEDFLVSNIILPVGSLIFLLFAVSKRGWGWENFMAEANAGRGLKVKNWMLVEKCKHTYKEGEHWMDLTLRGGEFIALYSPIPFSWDIPHWTCHVFPVRDMRESMPQSRSLRHGFSFFKRQT